jgi:hypothetical protein
MGKERGAVPLRRRFGGKGRMHALVIAMPRLALSLDPRLPPMCARVQEILMNYHYPQHHAHCV